MNCDAPRPERPVWGFRHFDITRTRPYGIDVPSHTTSLPQPCSPSDMAGAAMQYDHGTGGAAVGGAIAVCRVPCAVCRVPWRGWPGGPGRNLTK